MEIGIYTFAETPFDPRVGQTATDAAHRLRELVEEIELADQVGLDVFGVGEHHRADYAASAPAVVLAAARRAGHDPTTLPVSINSHGFIADTSAEAVDVAFPPYVEVMGRIGRERGWPPPTRRQFDAERSPHGALLIGSPQEVIEKILYEHELFANQRFLIQVTVGPTPHGKVMRAIELLGTQVAQPCDAPRLERRARLWNQRRGEIRCGTLIAARPRASATGRAQARLRRLRRMAADRRRGTDREVPISGRIEVSVDQAAKRLRRLSPDKLRRVRAYEQAHMNRQTVLAAIDALLEADVR